MNEILERYIKEGFLPKYDDKITIVHGRDGYNVLDMEDKPMLEQPYSSLKRLLLDLAKYTNY
jgi:hypothetical protein